MPAPPKPPTITPGGGDGQTWGLGSVDGQLIIVSATATPGTLLHTIPQGSNVGMQRIVVWGVNVDTVVRELIIEWGDNGTSNQIPISVGPRRGMQPIIPDFRLGNGLSVYAFCTTPNIFRLYVSVGPVTKSPSSRVASGT